MEEKDIIIKVEDVHKEYWLGSIDRHSFREELLRRRNVESAKIPERKRISALNGVSFEIERGEAVGIIGSNGAGKSTLLKILSRVTAPTSGKVYLDGSLSSMLEVGTGFHQELTGRENIYLNGAILGMSKKEVDKKMNDIIEFSECGEFIDTPVKRYSSGMYVKLAFSVAAHLDADIMVMDEVLAVGDMKFQQKCLGKMGDSANHDGKTVLYVSHNMNTIRQLCTRCVVLDKGKIIFDGDTEKAIEIYGGSLKTSEDYVELTNMKRSEEFRDQRIVMNYVEAVRKCKGRYTVGDKVAIRIGITSQKKYENAFLRAVIKHADGSPVTMMTNNVPFLIQEDKTEITVTMDTSNLAPGSYTASFVMYEVNQYGTDAYLDGVHSAYVFQIETDDLFNNRMEWKNQYWGNVVGNPLLIE